MGLMESPKTKTKWSKAINSEAGFTKTQQTAMLELSVKGEGGEEIQISNTNT